MSDVSVSPAGLLEAAWRSDAGRVRTNNEDVPLVDPYRGVYAVIDGVGGHAAGEVAAEIARSVIVQRLARPLGTPAERVREAITIANNTIFQHASENPALRGMTCVVTLALVTDHRLTVGHVGDTRLYLLNGRSIRKVTHDHSPVGEREDAHELSELEAMRHPRRNEVFRDVGSEYRDKDDADFVEVIEESFDDDSALLLCTDGLTDMVPSATIERLVRERAGRPDDVAEALVAAANDAGGADNVTVVYAEGPGFATSPYTDLPLVPFNDLPTTPLTTAPIASTSDAAANTRGFGRWILTSRTTWFATGALLGVVAALLLAWRMTGVAAFGTRTLIVGPSGVGAYSRIDDAMRAARAGDVVSVEPGVYRERVIVPDGVDLVARAPGSVIMTRAPAASGEWIAIEATGNMSGKIVGLRIESTPDAPIDVGMRLSGQARAVQSIDMSGPMKAGIEIGAASAASIHGSLLAVQGPSVVLDAGAQATLTNNTFLHSGRAAVPPIAMTGSGQIVAARNVFAGFGRDLVKGAADDDWRKALAGNIVVSSEPLPVR
jgi:PPM family protein phosphatase